MNENESPTKEEIPSKKEITIVGKTSRYMMKKLVEEKKSPVKRTQVEKWDVEKSWFTCKKQIQLLKKDELLLKDEILKKISSYKQQDVLKKRLNTERIIDYPYVKKLLLECKLKCHYCDEETYILYETRRDMNQWTVDRIDNSIGHDIENIVISCLKCNLQRRSRSSDKFLQTKKMVIKRENYSENNQDSDSS